METIEEYREEYMNPQQVREWLLSADTTVSDNAPEFLRRSLSGGQLVTQLKDSGGWAAVNAAYQDPPISTEQVLHPDKYRDGEGPVSVTTPDLADALGSDWAEIYNEVIGEWLLGEYLRSLSMRDYEEAAAGWGGDRFSLLEGPNEARALAVLTVWDSRSDAREFLDFLVFNAEVSDRRYLGINENHVLLILGPEEPVVATIRDQFSKFPEESALQGPKRAEKTALQVAMEAMMASQGIERLLSSAESTNSWDDNPAGIGVAPLYGRYFAEATSQWYYCWDSRGRITRQHESSKPC